MANEFEEARRKSAEPAIAQAGVGLLLEQGEPVETLVVDDSLRDRIEEEIHDVVGERAPYQELHGEVVDALGVLAVVCVLGPQPPLRKNVPHSAGSGLVALARTERRGIDHVVEHEVPLVERIARPRELDRATPVLLEKLLDLRLGRCPRPPQLVAAHSVILPAQLVCLPGIAGALADKRPIPDPHGRYVAVVAEHAQGARIQQEVLPGARGQPEPARREDAQHVAVREQRDVALD